MTSLRGLSAFPLTPMDEAGTVDLNALRSLVARLRDANVDSIGVLGSTGSYPYLTRDQRRRALSATVEEVGSQVSVLVGVGALRTDEAVKLAQDAKAVGATAGLLAAVSYTPLSDDEVFDHFTTVANLGGLPICIYDNPGTTHFRFSNKLISRLAENPRIIGIKSPSGPPTEAAAHLTSLRTIVPSSFSIGYSGDWTATEALIAGGETWYCVLGGLFPKVCLKIVRAVQDGNFEEARRLDTILAPIWDLMKEFSSLRVMYALAEHLALNKTSPPLPVKSLSSAATTRLHEVLAQMPDEFME